MNSNDLKIVRTPDGFLINVIGRANFQYGMPLRTFARGLEGDFGQICIDLKECIAMDSTFMGILAMLGLKGKKLNKPVEILNASEYNQGLLKGLGLEKLFIYINRESDAAGEALETTLEKGRLATAETVVEAHKTLIDADAANQQKFGSVIDYAEKDLDALKKQEQ